MAAESLRRRQVFDSMAALTAFVGSKAFWDSLDEESRREYADICRTRPDLKMFQLEKWVDSQEIQDAQAEFLLEEASGEPEVIVNNEY